MTASSQRPSSSQIDDETLLDMYERMILIRRFETEAERQYKSAKIGGYCHLSSGQEATSVATMDAMAAEDMLVTGYRCHGFALARGVSARAVMAELFGRVDGCAHGRGGSMHLLDPELGYYGGWGIVAGQLPVATGIALGLVRQERPQAVLCELGDGAVNMGAWHESLNLASLWNLPIVYLVVNNVYGMGTSVKRASAEPELFRRAHAHRMVGERIDGDDLEEVLAATSELMRTARERRRPAVLETLTYRYRGHSVADAGLSYRDRDEIKRHQEHDPIKRVRETLGERGITDEQFEQADERAAEQIADAVEFANASAEPPLDQLAYGMYAKGSDEQFERMKPGSPFGEQELVFGAGLGQ